MKESPPLDAAARGMAAGVVATGAMTAVMFLAQRAGFMGEMPPTKITRGLLRRSGLGTADEAETAASAVAHFAFGAVAGGLFAEGLSYAGRRDAAVPLGLIYGAGVWAFSYSVPIPALHLMPPPPRDRPGRPQSMLAAHLVYGAILGLLLRK
jgi:hypothetical protein